MRNSLKKLDAVYFRYFVSSFPDAKFLHFRVDVVIFRYFVFILLSAKLLHLVHAILGGPGALSRAGRKARRRFSSTGKKAPGYRLSPDHFQTVKRLLAPDWAQKTLCIIVPNRRTVFPEFFSWVRIRRLFSRHRSCPVRSPSFPNQKWRHYRWVEKRFGCYQQKQFNLHWENSVSYGSQCIVNNRKFKMQRQRESKKSNSLTRHNNNFARVFVHFFAVTARLPRENA